MLGIDDVTNCFKEQGLDRRQARLQASKLYQTLFGLTVRGKLPLVFICPGCTEQLGTCRCHERGRLAPKTKQWFYHDTSRKVNEWRLDPHSLLALSGSKRLTGVRRDTMDRLLMFVSYVESWYK